MISIVIPTYNVEKYIRDCLDSVLRQTFRNFEIIVSDDCSTDQTVDIVENYAQRFGQIQLVRRSQNSGNGGIPRNVFITHATGKYIVFLDSDDMLMDDALQTLFDIAEEFQSDIVSADKFYRFEDNDFDPVTKNINVKIYSQIAPDKLPKVPTIETENIHERLEKLFREELSSFIWNKMYRREFLIENRISFHNITIRQDNLFNLECICVAKNFVRIPQIVNLYRVRQGSSSHNPDSIKMFRKWTRGLIQLLEEADKTLDHYEYFNQNPQMKHEVLDHFAQFSIQQISTHYWKIDLHEIESIFLEEFSKYPSQIFAFQMFNIVQMYRKEISMLLKERQ